MSTGLPNERSSGRDPIPLHIPSYRELCDIAGWPNVTLERLTALLGAFPGQSIPFAQVRTTPYHTDGTLPTRAFLTPAAAELASEWVRTRCRGWWSCVDIMRELVLDRDGRIRLFDANGREFSQSDIDLLNGCDSEWKLAVSLICGENRPEPDFELLAAQMNL